MQQPPLVVSQAELVFLAKTVQELARISQGPPPRGGAVIWDAPRRTIVAVGYNEAKIHAEDSAIRKLSKTQKWFGNLVLIQTHPPHVPCAELIASVRGIQVIYYLDFYKNLDGVELLKSRKKFIQRLVAPTFSVT